MAAALPVGSRRLMKRWRHHIWLEKVSHHGPQWERWRPVENSGQQPKIRKHSLSSIRGTAFYPVIHGIPKTPAIAEAISLLKPRPVGLIVMVPCKTKFEAYKVTRRPEFAGMKCGSVRGDRIKNDPDTIARLNGYQRYVPDDGQAWVQKPRVKLNEDDNAQVNPPKRETGCN